MSGLFYDPNAKSIGSQIDERNGIEGLLSQAGRSEI